MTPLRLAFVYPQLKRLTGAQRLILMLATAVARQGHTVTLVTHYLSPACQALLEPRVHVCASGRSVDLTGRHLADSLIEYGAGLSLVARLPRDLDGAVFFGPPSMPALAWARRRSRFPLFAFCYEPPRFAYADRELISRRFGALAPLAAALFTLYRPLDRWLLGQADLVCANGRFGAEEIARVYRRQALVIDHGVELPPATPEAVRTVQQRLELRERPVLLTVNHLHPRKRIDLFLETLALVRNRMPDVVGVVAGEGADRARLQQLAAVLGIEAQVRWTGFVPESDLAALYRAATVYVHTGQRETFGLSVLEAAASGVPVVAVDEGGPRDILDGGRLGRLVPARPDALATSVLGLLQDPAAARGLGQAAALAVGERFRWDAGAATLTQAVAAAQRGGSEAEIVAARSAGAPS